MSVGVAAAEPLGSVVVGSVVQAVTPSVASVAMAAPAAIRLTTDLAVVAGLIMGGSSLGSCYGIGRTELGLNGMRCRAFAYRTSTGAQ